MPNKLAGHGLHIPHKWHMICMESALLVYISYAVLKIHSKPTNHINWICTQVVAL